MKSGRGGWLSMRLWIGLVGCAGMVVEGEIDKLIHVLASRP